MKKSVLPFFLFFLFSVVYAQKSSNVFVTDAGSTYNIDSLEAVYQHAKFAQPPSVNACASTNNLLAAYNQNNGQRGIMFDITAINCVTINCFESNFATGTTNVEVWYRPGTHVGFQNSAAGWTLIGTAVNVVGAGVNLATAIPLNIGVTINAGATAGFYITRATANGPVVQYTNGTALGAVHAADANIQIKDGTGKEYPFGMSFTPRRFNGTVFYSVNTSTVTAPAVSGASPVCSGTTQTFSVTPVAGATGYNWSVPAGSTISSGQGTNTINVTMGLTSGNVCVAPIIPCASVIPSCFSVTISPPLTLTTTATPTAICAGSTSQLTVSGATTYTWSPAASLSCTNCTNPIASPTATVTYTVTGATGACTGSATRTITVNPLPVPSASNTGPYCSGQNIVLNASGGATYSWSGPNTFTSSVQNPNITSSTAVMSGTYTVTATTVNGCTATATTSVTVNTTPSPTASNTGPYCEGSSIALSSSGGSTYSWSGPSLFSSTAQNPAIAVSTLPMSGIYTVTAVANSCSATATTTVTVNPMPVPAASNTGPYCEGDVISLFSSGGAGYNWSGPLTYTSSNQNESINTSTTTMSGVYTVTVTLGTCTATATTSVTVNPLPVVTVNSTAICITQTTATLTANGAVNYSWTNGTTPSTGSVVTADPLTTTDYTVTGADANGCINTAVATVTANPLPIVSVNSPAICPTFTANLNASGATNYSWSAGTTPSNSANVTASPAATTQFTVTGTDANGCFSTAVSTVTVNAQLVLNAGIDDTVCVNDNILLNGSGGIAGTVYTWNPGALNGASQSIVASSTITYTLSGVDPNGCAGMDSVIITVPAAITLNTNGTNASCNAVCDGQLSVSASPATGGFSNYTYLWTNGGTLSTASGLCAGNYTVTVTNNAGCSNSAALTVTEPVVLSASAGTIVPASCNASCDGGATITAAGGTAPYNYSWSSLGSGNAPNNLCAGSYTCTVTDFNNCSATTTLSITEPSVINVSIASVSTICIGQTATLTASASGGNGGYVYTWTGGTNTNNAASVTASPVVTSNYTVSVTDANNCAAATATVDVNLNSALSVVASNDVTQCAGATASMSAMASGGNGVFTYTWASGTVPGTGSNVSASPNTTTTYTVTVTDGCGTPAASDTVVVNVNPLPVLNITSTVQSGCPQLCVGFNASSSSGINAITWQFTSGQNISNTAVTMVCFDDAGNYGATINVTDVNGCQNTFTNNNLVTVFALPEPQFAYGPTDATVFNPLISFTDMSTGPAVSSWQWNFGDADNSTSAAQHPAFDFGTSGDYPVTLITTSADGCVDSTTQTIHIEAEFALFVPNAFTPNKNNLNDVFLPKGIGIMSSDYHMYIYDRWGNKVFQSDDWSIGWDGKTKDGSAFIESDVYVWKIELRMYDGTDKSYVGHVTVVK